MLHAWSVPVASARELINVCYSLPPKAEINEFVRFLKPNYKLKSSHLRKICLFITVLKNPKVLSKFPKIPRWGLKSQDLGRNPKVWQPWLYGTILDFWEIKILHAEKFTSEERSHGIRA